jgi:hypothetical protein
MISGVSVLPNQWLPVAWEYITVDHHGCIAAKNVLEQ